MSIFKESLLKPLRPEGLKPGTTMNFLFVGNPGCGEWTDDMKIKTFVALYWLLMAFIRKDNCCGINGKRDD